MTEHVHAIPPHGHGAHQHDHGGQWVHDHEDDGRGHDHDVWEMIGHGPDHHHQVPAHMLQYPEAVDPDAGTTCGHVGSDPGVARHVVRHRGAESVLCQGCMDGFDWEAADAVAGPGRIPGRGGQQAHD